jgi:hypothetical protein
MDDNTPFGPSATPAKSAAVRLPGVAPQPASRLVRRVHMYLGLFLAPWMLMYAASTAVMNHREFVQSFYSPKSPAMILERQLSYSRAFHPETKPQQIGEQILLDIGLEGAHRVTGGQNGKPLVIERQHAFAPRRITWEPERGQLIIHRQEFRGPTFLERMHRRRGFQHPYAFEDSWAFSVDLAVLAMIFWAVSGLWLWWELRPTRIWGVASMVLGLVLFALFLTVL